MMSEAILLATGKAELAALEPVGPEGVEEGSDGDQ